jgi:hypothetical protein
MHRTAYELFLGTAHKIRERVLVRESVDPKSERSEINKSG